MRQGSKTLGALGAPLAGSFRVLQAARANHRKKIKRRRAAAPCVGTAGSATSIVLNLITKHRLTIAGLNHSLHACTQKDYFTQLHSPFFHLSNIPSYIFCKLNNLVFE